MVHDPDLTPVLRDSSDEDLKPLVDYVLDAATNSLCIKDVYKEHKDYPRFYTDELVLEIREFGGNSLVNLFRSDGVPYREVVEDVAGKLGVSFDRADQVEQIEMKILTKIFVQSIAKMDAAQRTKLEEEFRKLGMNNVSLSAGAPIGMIMAQLGVQMTGFLAYKMAVIVANAVAKTVLGRGLTLGGNALLTQTLGVLAGPIGWAISGLWTAIDLSGPAYRVTIPVVCHVAYLRLKHQYRSV